MVMTEWPWRSPSRGMCSLYTQLVRIYPMPDTAVFRHAHCMRPRSGQQAHIDPTPMTKSALWNLVCECASACDAWYPSEAVW